MFETYEHWLALIIVLVASIGAVIPFKLAVQNWKSGRRSLRYWLAAAVLSLAAAMFALQFIGMLALDLPIPASYDVPVTLLSLLIAILICGFALHTQAGELVQTNVRLNDSQARYRQLVELSPDAIFIETDGLIVFANSAAHKLLGATSTEQLLGKQMLDMVAPESRDSAAERLGELLAHGRWLEPLEEKLIRFDGGTVEVEAIGAQQMYESRLSAQLVMRDITQRKQVQERLNYLAQYDSLTDLPNRNLFFDRLSQALARAQRNTQLIAVFIVDLDRFKEINDTLGHSAGDKLLKAVAHTLRKLLRQTDTVARFGGDEFTLLFEDIDNATQVLSIAEKIQDTFRQPLSVDGREIFATVSIGIALYPEGGADLERLLQAADIALYHAKEQGRNTYSMFSADMDRDAGKRLDMENLLRRALERDEFVLHYQPKVSVATGRITGVEALIRWHSPELGLVSPAAFIPLAEKNGLIVQIGEWVLRSACSQAKAWQQQGHVPLVMAVNVSPRQFRQKNVVESVARVLRDTQLEARFLELEITEGVMMDDPIKAVGILHSLHALDVSLSIDDFGTGYSSLAYLKRFPVQKLKIDRSFVRDLAGPSDESAAIATAVIALARSLKLGVIAEGVETAIQLQLLADFGCDEYQGYLFSKPLPASDFALLLESTAEADKNKVQPISLGLR